LSPWDRNHPEYGRPEYITYFRNQLTELLTNYGPIFEVWFDGANGGTGYYGGANENRKIDRTTYYDWSNTYKLIRELQPDIVIWNDGGNRADLRWVGTEAGFIGETNWSLLNATGDVPFNMLHHGVEDGDSWVPGEVNTSIRPEWFYHPSEDTKVKTLPHLMDTYYNSIGRNATLLLNFPIMPNGLIHENDEKAALDLAKAVKEAFAVNLARQTKAEASNVRGNAEESAADNVIDSDKDTYWATDDDVTKASLTLDFGKPTTFNRFMAQEYIRLGQRVKAFTIEGLIDGNWKELAKATTVGYKRILRFPTVAATQLRFNINDAKCCPVISNIGVYNAPQILTSPTDYMPTAFDLKEMVGYTWAHLLAQAVNMTSPLLHFAGKYQDFIGNPAENLLRHLPSTWDETIVLSGSEIGKTVGFARRRGDTWFIGVLNGGEAATLPIELSFLEQGTWQAEVFGDDPGHPATFQRQSNNVRASDSLTVSMSPRGGAVIGLTKTTP